MAPRKHLPAGSASAASLPPMHSPVPPPVTVVFIRPHTHAGKRYVKDDVLVCDAAARDLLRRFGVIGEG